MKCRSRTSACDPARGLTRRKPFFPFVFVVLAVAEAFALAGCPSTGTTTTYTPITGIIINSASLTAGHGCGTGPNQVFMYAALLSYVDGDGGPDASPPPGPPVQSGVFDCFSDGIFSNLPADEAGSLNFHLSILAYNQASYPTTLDCPPGTSEAGSSLPCPGNDPGVVLLNEGTPTWTTSCNAAQQAGVPVLASCGPLLPTGGSDAGGGDAATAPGLAITVDTAGFLLPEGGAFTCGTSFTSTQATYQVGAQSGQIGVSTCSTPLTIASPTVAGATYAITVQLLDGSVPVGTVACQAQASATSPVTATCGPVVGAVTLGDAGDAGSQGDAADGGSSDAAGDL